MLDLRLSWRNRPEATSGVDGLRLSTGPHDFNDTSAEFR